MKKLITTTLMAVTVIAFSCKKDTGYHETSTPVNDAARYNVTLGIGSFEAQYTDMRVVNLADDTAAYLKYLYTALYDSAGNQIRLTEQLRFNAYDTSFGKFYYTLPAGNYTVVFVAANDTAVIYQGLFNNKNATLQSLQINNLFTSGGYDIFYNKTRFKVSNQDTIASNLQLHRLTGKMELQLKDAAPLLDSSRSLYVAISGFSRAYRPYIDSFTTSVAGDSMFLARTSSSVWAGFCLGGYNRIKTYIYGSLNNPPVYYNQPVYRVIDNLNVYVYPDMKTILTGYLVNNSFSGGSGLSVNTDFSQTVTTTF